MRRKAGTATNSRLWNWLAVPGLPTTDTSPNSPAPFSSPRMRCFLITRLTRRNFYKSMMTHADHRIWQDVYYSPTPVDQEAYIKITMRDAAPVIQFKEK